MKQQEKTNIHLDAQIAGASPDAQYDRYNVSDAQSDFNYNMAKLLDVFSALNGSLLTDVIINQNGGIVTDSGSGQVDISEVYGIGLAVDGSVRPVYIPQLTNVDLPSGWDDGRDVWVIAKHEFITTGSPRNHAKFPAQQYNFKASDSYYGNADNTLLFTDSAPASGVLTLDKFTMAGTVFTKLSGRSSEAVLNNVNIETLRLLYNGSMGSFIKTNADNSTDIYINAYIDEDGTTIRIKSDGRSRRLRLDSQGGWDASQRGLSGDEAIFNNGSLVEAGKINGNLDFNIGGLPPIVSAGVREIGGIYYQLTSDYSMVLADAFGVCSQLFSDYTYTWMKVLINDEGQYKYIPSFDSQPVASLTDIGVTDIVVSSGVATLTVSSTTGLSPNHIIITKGNPIGELLGKVVTVPDGTHLTCKTSAPDNTYVGGTYSARYRIATLHGSGTITGITVDADIEKHSPSPEFNPVFNGYYRDIDGDIDITTTGTWRDIGAFFIDASGNVLYNSILSYKSGKNKNDNELRIDTHNGYGSTSTRRPRFLNERLVRGNDYTLINTAALGSEIVNNTSMEYSMAWYHRGNATGGQQGGISLNADPTAAFSSLPFDEMLTNGRIDATNADEFEHSVLSYLYVGDVVGPHLSGNTVPSGNNTFFRLTGV